MADTSYAINYDDKRFTDIEAEKTEAITESDKTYDSMITESDKYYDAQINASKEWAETQTKNQQERTDFTIDQIEQQKAQAKKDYTKEQSGAYVDWQKQSGDYGVSAEQEAAQGMRNTGYSESSQVSMYNTYQNRVATARETYNRAVLNYDNAIKDAQLQNNSALAEIAYNALSEQNELALEGFQYKNSLVLEKANKKLELDQMYYNRSQDVLDQMNAENSLAEQIRQFNESLAEERRQHEESLAEEKRQFNFENKLGEFAEDSSSSSGSSSSGSSSSSKKSSSSSSKKSSSTSIKKSSSKNSSGELDGVDTKSVLALGQGPISGTNLAKQVNSGKVIATETNKGISVKYNTISLPSTKYKLP